MFEAKANEGTLAGQAAEFMGMMERKVPSNPSLAFLFVLLYSLSFLHLLSHSVIDPYW